jgi:hypothetical protein
MILWIFHIFTVHKELVGTTLSHCVHNFSINLQLYRLGYNRSRCTCILPHANKAGEEGEVYPLRYTGISCVFMLYSCYVHILLYHVLLCVCIILCMISMHLLHALIRSTWYYMEHFLWQWTSLVTTSQSSPFIRSTECRVREASL